MWQKRSIWRITAFKKWKSKFLRSRLNQTGRSALVSIHMTQEQIVFSSYTIRVYKKTLKTSNCEKSCFVFWASFIEIHFLKWPSRSCVLEERRRACRFRFGTQVTRARQVNGVRAGSVRIFSLRARSNKKCANRILVAARALTATISKVVFHSQWKMPARADLVCVAGT